VRELREELGIEVTEASPWITRVYAYTHATVRLHFFRVTRWEHEPRPLEDQAIRWQPVEKPDVAPMLPANAPVLAALALPAVMVISNAAAFGIDGWIARLSERLVDERLLVQATVTAVVQVQGKVRARLDVPPSISEDDLEAAALADPAVVRAIDGNTVRRVIVRAPKLVNIVVG